MQTDKYVKTESVRLMLTDTDIVVGLRSNEPEQRRLCLEALFPNDSAVMIRIDKSASAVTATGKIDAGRMFGAIIYVAMQVGKMLGLTLGWGQTPEDAQAQASKIQIAPAGSIG